MGIYKDTMYIDPAYADALARAGLDSVQRALDCRGDRLAAWRALNPSTEVFVLYPCKLLAK